MLFRAAATAIFGADPLALQKFAALQVAEFLRMSGKTAAVSDTDLTMDGCRYRVVYAFSQDDQYTWDLKEDSPGGYLLAAYHEDVVVYEMTQRQADSVVVDGTWTVSVADIEFAVRRL